MKHFRYSGEKLKEVRFPLGGIGAGCISMDGGARFVDWEIKNRPNKESYNGFSHIAVKAERQGKVIDARALNGPFQPPFMGKGLHPFGGYTYGPARETLAGVPHFSDVELTGTFPKAEYRFGGAKFPAKVSLKAWSPFEPMNDFDSSLPLSFFEVTFENTEDEEIEYSTAFTVCNPDRTLPMNRVERGENYTGLLCSNNRDKQNTADWGQLYLLTDAADVSVQQNWYRGLWFDGLNIFWQEFAAPGKLKNRELTDITEKVYDKTDHGVLCAHVTCPPHGTVSVRFVLSWYYPNYEKYWAMDLDEGKRPLWRNWYATQFADARELAGYGLTHCERMEKAVDDFTEFLYESTLPEEVIDAAGSTLAVLKSPTCVRLADGSFYGWEGSHANWGSCEGSCQHVWNYQYALPMLFPALERSMRNLDYLYNTRPDGGVPFRLNLPVGSLPSDFRPCADGQMGGVIKMYREWKISGDDAWMKSLWPYVKRSIQFVWSDKNIDQWDPQMSGVLTGRQHQTLDMELFTENSWLSGMYVVALEAGARMAEAVGDEAFAALCREIRAKGEKFMDENLFNGEYFYQKIDLSDKSILERFAVPEKDGQEPEVLRSYWNDEIKQIKYQIGEGSSVDQLLGQWHADLCGLGDFFDREKTKTALSSIYKYNFVKDMTDFFNPCRIYCLQDEGGVLICGYPEGRVRPAISAPYAEETMHGFEYSAACHMILRGLEEEGLECIRALRSRYDGARRNPWNEIECGGNYARSMAAWALVMTYQGLSVDMTRGCIGFKPLASQEHHQCLWAVSSAWGCVDMRAGSFRLETTGGQISLKALALPSVDGIREVSRNGEAVVFTCVDGEIHFSENMTLGAGDVLTVSKG